jgi:catechol 2,3-dioxygenase-like lactoylglutathione lyase family enzyme
MKAEAVIPVLRMFDYQKAKEFYVDWLGFEILGAYIRRRFSCIYGNTESQY